MGKGILIDLWRGEWCGQDGALSGSAVCLSRSPPTSCSPLSSKPCNALLECHLSGQPLSTSCCFQGHPALGRGLSSSAAAPTAYTPVLGEGCPTASGTKCVIVWATN